MSVVASSDKPAVAEVEHQLSPVRGYQNSVLVLWVEDPQSTTGRCQFVHSLRFTCTCTPLLPPVTRVDWHRIVTFIILNVRADNQQQVTWPYRILSSGDCMLMTAFPKESLSLPLHAVVSRPVSRPGHVASLTV